MQFNQTHGLNTTAGIEDLTRAFALVGLIRDLDDSVPNDLIYIYLKDTMCCNLGGAIIGLNENCHNLFQIPESLKKQAREYMLECLTEHINGIYRQCCAWERHRSTGFSTVYPEVVHQMLSGLNISKYNTLQDIKGGIDAFHAALTSDTCTTKANDDAACLPHNPMWKNKQAWYPLTASEYEKLLTLDYIFGTAFDPSAFNPRSVPTYKFLEPGIRGTFCNLLDILLILAPKKLSFDMALRQKLIYEYARLADVGSNGTNPNNFAANAIRLNDTWKTVIDESIAVYSQFSPQAVVCIGRGIVAEAIRQVVDDNDTKSNAPTYRLNTLGVMFGLTSIYNDFIKNKMKRRLPTTSVKMYVKAEINAQRRNLYQYLEERNCKDNYCNAG